MLKPVNYDGIFGSVKNGATEFSVETALALLETFLIYQTDILGNDLGLYRVAENVRSGKAMWGRYSKANYVTKPRPTGCTRDPVRGILLETDEVALCDRHVFLEICNDDLVNRAWRSLFGHGNDINDILSSDFGKYAFYQYVKNVISGIGNDFAKNAFWGLHPAITDSVAANTKLTDEMKTRILNTLTTCGSGWLTTVDALGALGGNYSNLKVEINDEDCVGYKFIGDAMELIRSLEDAAHADFDDALPGLATENKLPVVLVTKGIFRRLKEQIIANHKEVTSAFQYLLNGKFTNELDSDLVGKVSPYALVFDNKIIKCQNEWDSLGKELGFAQHRALMTVPQNLGVALDIPGMDQFGGMGLMIEKAPGLINGGKYHAETNYETATMIIDPKFMVNAISKTVLIP